MRRLRRGRPGWAIPGLLVLAVVLAAALAFNLANLEPGSETVPPTAPAGAPRNSPVVMNGAVLDVLLIVVSGLLLAGIVYAIILRGRRKQGARPRSRSQIVSSLLGLLLVILVLLAFPRLSRIGRAVNETTDPASAGSAGQNVTGWSTTAVGTQVGLLLLLMVFMTIVATTYLLRRGVDGFAAGRGVRADGILERREAIDAVRTAIGELEIGADIRTTILACFQRFCRLLGARGITEQEPLTAREIEDLAVDRLRVSRDASQTLTSLFEEARYSDHLLREADRVRAIDSLAGIRAALEA